MLTITKQCVGCGSDYVVLKADAESSLYCTEDCKTNHSIFNIESVVTDHNSKQAR